MKVAGQTAPHPWYWSGEVEIPPLAGWNNTHKHFYVGEVARANIPGKHRHGSHFFEALRHRSDERNPTDVIGRSAPVNVLGGRPVKIKIGMLPIPIQLYRKNREQRDTRGSFSCLKVLAYLSTPSKI